MITCYLLLKRMKLILKLPRTFHPLPQVSPLYAPLYVRPSGPTMCTTTSRPPVPTNASRANADD
jgi:hypothetical protein